MRKSAVGALTHKAALQQSMNRAETEKKSAKENERN